MRGRLIALLLFACAGSRPVEMPRETKAIPAPRWCVTAVSDNRARYEVCTQLRINCQNLIRLGFQYGQIIGVAEIGECVLR